MKKIIQKLDKKDKVKLLTILIPSFTTMLTAIILGAIQIFYTQPNKDVEIHNRHKREEIKFVKKIDSIRDKKSIDSIDFNRIIKNKFKKFKK